MCEKSSRITKQILMVNHICKNYICEKFVMKFCEQYVKNGFTPCKYVEKTLKNVENTQKNTACALAKH